MTQKRRLLAALREFDTDYGIEHLFDLAFGKRELSLRDKQQRLGSVICRLNGTVHGERIVPGEQRHTYRKVHHDPIKRT